jgi:hypothetical protein
MFAADNALGKWQALSALEFTPQLAIGLGRTARTRPNSVPNFAFFKGITMTNDHGESNSYCDAFSITKMRLVRNSEI